MKPQVLIASFFAVLSFGVFAGGSDRVVLQEDVKKAMEFTERMNKVAAELKSIQYSDPGLFKKKLESFQKERNEFDMVSKLQSAISLIKEDASGPLGFDALKVIALQSHELHARGDEPEEGKLSDDDMRSLLNDVIAQSLKYHINNEYLFQVLSVPLMRLSYSDGYSAPREALQRILNESESRTVRGQAAFQLASNAIETSQSTRVPEDDRRQAGMDVATYSELVLEEYADVKALWSDKTVKSLLEGKLFSLNALVQGKVLPDVEAQNLQGEMDSLANYRGKVVLIDFWATWCGPCKAALPGIAELKKELTGKPFEVISISVDDEVETVLGYQENEQPMPWVNWHIGPDSEILTEWAVRGFPTYYVVDAEGVILSNKYLDNTMKDQIREWVNTSAKQ